LRESRPVLSSDDRFIVEPLDRWITRAVIGLTP
jgi:hypothetical protein